MANTDPASAAKALRAWAEQVDRELFAYRAQTAAFGNPEGIPRATWAPGQVEWYQHWDGPYRWVLCTTFENNDDMALLAFWTKPRWAERETKVVYMTDPAAVAAEIWDFLQPDTTDAAAE